MRRLIVDTATQILLDEGIDQVSIRRIADRIEYSPGTIYLYFEDKDDILYEVAPRCVPVVLRCRDDRRRYSRSHWTV